MSRCFVVLGMHRSATSLIAGGLHRSGVFMGEKFIPRDSGNPKGYFEDKEFVNLNKYILVKAGGDWCHPPREKRILALRKNDWVQGQIRELVKTRNQQHKLWGWKDPRTVLTIRLYLPYLPEHFFFVAFRRPEDCAGSLSRRDGSVGEQNLTLVREYNRRLMNFLQDQQVKWL
jgi:hypothetical protein